MQSSLPAPEQVARPCVACPPPLLSLAYPLHASIAVHSPALWAHLAPTGPAVANTSPFPHPPPPVQRFDYKGNFIGEWKSLSYAVSIGTGSEPFDSPSYMAIDKKTDTLFIAEYAVAGIDGVVKKVTRDGKLLMQWGNFGSDNSQFKGTAGVTMDIMGDLYVADPGNCRIQKFRPNGRFVTAIYGTCVDRPPRPEQFNYAKGVAVDRPGNVWVADAGRNLIMKFAPRFS